MAPILATACPGAPKAWRVPEQRQRVLLALEPDVHTCIFHPLQGEGSRVERRCGGAGAGPAAQP